MINMGGLPQRALPVTFDLLKGWLMVLVSYQARTAVVSSEVRRRSLSTDVAHTRRPTIKIMCLSRGRKHAGSTRKRFSWLGRKRTWWSWVSMSPVRPWRYSFQAALLRQSRRCDRRWDLHMAQWRPHVFFNVGQILATFVKCRHLQLYCFDGNKRWN